MDRAPKENIVLQFSILLSNGYVLFGQLDPPQKYRNGDFSEETDIFEVFGKNSFNSQTHEIVGGTPDPEDLPSDFSLDYVRVWQKKEDK